MRLLKNVLKGTVAGFIATGPMTASMLLMRRWLPWWQQGPLPPHEVTSQALDNAGLDHIDEEYHHSATWAGHFGYGAASGAFYAVVHKLPLPLLPKSILYGASVWAASYLGWIPAVGWLKSTGKRPLQRNTLMIAAHLVWGPVTGKLFKRWHTTQAAPQSEGAG